MENLKLQFNVPISESAYVNGAFIIQGTAINETITSNNHKFIAEELEKSANTLTGVPLLVDHENKVENIKGRVLSGMYNDLGKRVDFRAQVMDLDTQLMIKDGRLNSVSVGAIVEKVDEDKDGILIPRGITFKELSLVAVPADAGATFTIAMKEAYETKIKEEFKTLEAKVELMKKAENVNKEKDIVHEQQVIQPINPANEAKALEDVHGAVDIEAQEAMKGGIERMSEEKIAEVKTEAVAEDKTKILMEKMEAMEKKMAELESKKAVEEEAKKSYMCEECGWKVKASMKPKDCEKCGSKMKLVSEDKAKLTNEYFDESEADVREGYRIVQEGSDFTMIRNKY